MTAQAEAAVIDHGPGCACGTDKCTGSFPRLQVQPGHEALAAGLVLPDKHGSRRVLRWSGSVVPEPLRLPGRR